MGADVSTVDKSEPQAHRRRTHPALSPLGECPHGVISVMLPRPCPSDDSRHSQRYSLLLDLSIHQSHPFPTPESPI